MALLLGYFSSANTCPKAILKLSYPASKSDSTLPFLSLKSLSLHHGLLSDENAGVIGQNYGHSVLRSESF